MSAEEKGKKKKVWTALCQSLICHMHTQYNAADFVNSGWKGNLISAYLR